MDQNASTDYYIVASPRFISNPQWSQVTGVAILQYSNSKGKASGPLPDAPNDYYDKYYSINQARSIRSVQEQIMFVNWKYFFYIDCELRISDYCSVFEGCNSWLHLIFICSLLRATGIVLSE
jgi:hypothetical protein